MAMGTRVTSQKHECVTFYDVTLVTAGSHDNEMSSV